MKKELPPNANTWTAIGLIVLGILAIYLAWNGTSDLPFTQAQIPYMISGGFGGAALVGSGLVLVRTFEARRDAQRIVEQLERVARLLEDQNRLLQGTQQEGTDADALQDQPFETAR